MEKKSKTSYNTEYARKRRESTRRQVRGDTLSGTASINLNIKKEQKEALKKIADSKELSVTQLIRNLVEDYLKQN